MFFSQEGQPETARRRGIIMIKLTKLNKNNDETFILNCELIETIEERPDTTIRLVNGKHFVVAESAAEVISKVVTFKRSIYR
jgi:flagellar protein FlbD